ncbi:MAG: toll/interleukin-1 receptor domain-containing protein [Acidobacteriota bacterium]
MAKVFVSASREDADFAHQLCDRLGSKGVDCVAGPQVSPGDEGGSEALQDIADCDALILILTPEYLSPSTESERNAVLSAAGAGQPLIPLLRRECQLPPELQDLEPFDATGAAGFDQAYPKILEILGVPVEPNPAQESAATEVSTSPVTGQAAAADFWDRWQKPLIFAGAILVLPAFAFTALTFFGFNLPSYWDPAPPVTEKAHRPSSERKVSTARLAPAGESLFGREKELKRLDEAWEDPQQNVISLVAWGGVGKSTLVNHWLGSMASEDYRGAERVFGWTFQGTSDKPASADLFIAEALGFFGDPNPTQGDPWARGARLASLVASSRTLLILDGLEPLQSIDGDLKDPALQTLVKNLAAHNNSGVRHHVPCQSGRDRPPRGDDCTFDRTGESVTGGWGEAAGQAGGEGNGPGTAGSLGRLWRPRPGPDAAGHLLGGSSRRRCAPLARSAPAG